MEEESWKRNHGGGIMEEESLLWTPCCGLVAVESLLWNREPLEGDRHRHGGRSHTRQVFVRGPNREPLEGDRHGQW